MPSHRPLEFHVGKCSDLFIRICHHDMQNIDDMPRICPITMSSVLSEAQFETEPQIDDLFK